MDFSFMWNIHMYAEFKYIQTMVKKNPIFLFFLVCLKLFFLFLLSLMIIGWTLTNNSIIIIIIIISLQHYYFWHNGLFHFHI